MAGRVADPFGQDGQQVIGDLRGHDAIDRPGELQVQGDARPSGPLPHGVGNQIGEGSAVDTVGLQRVDGVP